MLEHSGSNWNLEMLVFAERGKPEYPEKNLSEQRREPTTNSTHIWRRVRESNPGHIGGRRVLSPLRHPCSPTFNILLPNSKVHWTLQAHPNYNSIIMILGKLSVTLTHLSRWLSPAWYQKLRPLLNSYSTWLLYILTWFFSSSPKYEIS